MAWTEFRRHRVAACCGELAGPQNWCKCGRRGKAAVGVPLIGTGMRRAKRWEPGPSVPGPGTHLAPLRGSVGCSLDCSPPLRPGPFQGASGLWRIQNSQLLPLWEQKPEGTAGLKMGPLRPLHLQCGSAPCRPQVSTTGAGGRGKSPARGPQRIHGCRRRGSRAMQGSSEQRERPSLGFVWGQI